MADTFVHLGISKIAFDIKTNYYKKRQKLWLL